MPGAPSSRWPPLFRALAAQALAFLLLLALARAGLRLPGLGWVGLQAVAAAALGMALGLPAWWSAWNLIVPFAAWWALRHPLSTWWYALAFVGLGLVFGGGLLTRVPLYNASRDAWSKLEGLLPNRADFAFIDLGCGLGGPLAFLAARHPAARFCGVEASPLPFVVAWLRCLPHRNAEVRLGSLWAIDLGRFDVAYAFLSPAPMPRLWAKVQQEMAPGSCFVSHSFAVPGREPDRVVPVHGRAGARLMAWERA